MDGLEHDERALAWAASWDPSFAGIAIVNKDFTFCAVNPQFCEILGVTPADLVGRRFQDVTPQKTRELDEKNATLVMRGVINSYILQKAYEIAGVKTVEVMLLVSGVYNQNGEFLFFVSRIMQTPSLETSSVSSISPKQTEYFWTAVSSKITWNGIKLTALAAAAIGAFIKGLLHLGK